ncbi:prepilin peptidase [Corynebacterium sp. H128]|uniref:prepilin peptidase n=1 Tax=Corynebacterium sp. H128 TaxID=3133427 RepID=UPI0030B6313B
MGLGVFLWATALCGWDICFRRLPNLLTLPAAMVALVVFPGSWWGASWALLYLGRGIGGGDAKLAISLGVVAAREGVVQLLLVILLASVLSLMACVVFRTRSVPHGPSMLAATFLLVADI